MLWESQGLSSHVRNGHKVESHDHVAQHVGDEGGQGVGEDEIPVDKSHQSHLRRRPAL